MRLFAARCQPPILEAGNLAGMTTTSKSFTVVKPLNSQILERALVEGDTIDLDPAVANRYVTAGYLTETKTTAAKSEG
jgi:hypothetical protein